MNPYKSESQILEAYDAWWDGYERGMIHGIYMRYLAIGFIVMNALMLVYLILSIAATKS